MRHDRGDGQESRWLYYAIMAMISVNTPDSSSLADAGVGTDADASAGGIVMAMILLVPCC